MTAELPPPGTIVSYSYLWARQHERGETEGRKTRPACLVVRVHRREDDTNHLMLLAITSREPASDTSALEIPDIERARAGLTRYPRAWIVIGEYNYDIAEQSWYFETGIEPLGAFSAAYLRKVTDALRKEMRAGAKRVDRTT
ncbi:MAG TPA: hypothetical protein VGG10_16580 [Rhizomicrobium sp.]|jgi:hypothetical protein